MNRLRSLGITALLFGTVLSGSASAYGSNTRYTGGFPADPSPTMPQNYNGYTAEVFPIVDLPSDPVASRLGDQDWEEQEFHDRMDDFHHRFIYQNGRGLRGWESSSNLGQRDADHQQKKDDIRQKVEETGTFSHEGKTMILAQRAIGADTFVATPRAGNWSQGNQQPWRNSRGHYTGGNPFGSAPKNLY